MTVPDVLRLSAYKRIKRHVNERGETEQSTTIGLAADQNGEPALTAEGKPDYKLINLDDWPLVVDLCEFTLEPPLDTADPPSAVALWAIPTFWAWVNEQNSLGK